MKKTFIGSSWKTEYTSTQRWMSTKGNALKAVKTLCIKYVWIRCRWTQFSMLLLMVSKNFPTLTGIPPSTSVIYKKFSFFAEHVGHRLNVCDLHVIGSQFSVYRKFAIEDGERKCSTNFCLFLVTTIRPILETLKIEQWQFPTLIWKARNVFTFGSRLTLIFIEGYWEMFEGLAL